MRTRAIRVLLVLVVVWCVVGVGVAVTAPRDLDTSFSTDGKLTTAFEGYDRNGSNRDFAVARYTSCLLYTSDAADDTPCVDLGGRGII